MTDPNPEQRAMLESDRENTSATSPTALLQLAGDIYAVDVVCRVQTEAARVYANMKTSIAMPEVKSRQKIDNEIARLTGSPSAESKAEARRRLENTEAELDVNGRKIVIHLQTVFHDPDLVWFLDRAFDHMKPVGLAEFIAFLDDWYPCGKATAIERMQCVIYLICMITAYTRMAPRSAFDLKPEDVLRVAEKLDHLIGPGRWTYFMHPIPGEQSHVHRRAMAPIPIPLSQTALAQLALQNWRDGAV